MAEGPDLTSEVGVRMAVKGLLEFQRNMHTVTDEITRLKGAQERATVSTKQASTGWFNLNRAMRWLTTGTFVAGIFAIVSGIKQMAVSVVTTGIGFNAMKESALVTFETLTRSARTAHKMFNQLMDLALKSPFDPENVQRSAQMLLTFGFAANQIVPIMKRLANVAAANPMMGPEAIQHLALVLGQIHATGRLLGQDVLQLNQFGINAYKVVGESIGKTYNQVRKMGQAGLVSSKQVIDALMAYIDRNYGNLSEKLSHKYVGLASNLRQAYQMATGALLAPFMPGLERRMLQLQNWMTSTSFKKSMQALAKDIMAVWRALSPLLIGLAKLSISLIKLYGGPIVAIIKALAPVLVPALRLLGNVLQWLARHELVLALILLFSPFFEFEAAAIGIAIAIDRFGPAFARLVQKMEPMIKLWRYLAKVNTILLTLSITLKMQSLKEWVDKHTGGAVTKAVKIALPGVGAGLALKDLFDYTTHAAGGIMTRPGWTMTGEQGPELRWTPPGTMDVPLPALGGGERTVILKLNEREFGRAVFNVFGDDLARG